VRTAIDTNVISIIWSGDPPAAEAASLLGRAAREGALVISAPVYVELMAHPKATQHLMDHFLANTRVEVDFVIDEPVWRETAKRYASYALRRRKSGGGEAKRRLPDFIIGAHAYLCADRLFTLDPQRYAQDFPKLRLMWYGLPYPLGSVAR
jgi:predicted nucleic acid-binding protein